MDPKQPLSNAEAWLIYADLLNLTMHVVIGSCLTGLIVGIAFTAMLGPSVIWLALLAVGLTGPFLMWSRSRRIENWITVLSKDEVSG